MPVFVLGRSYAAVEHAQDPAISDREVFHQVGADGNRFTIRSGDVSVPKYMNSPEMRPISRIGTTLANSGR